MKREIEPVSALNLTEGSPDCKTNYLANQNSAKCYEFRSLIHSSGSALIKQWKQHKHDENQCDYCKSNRKSYGFESLKLEDLVNPEEIPIRLRRVLCGELRSVLGQKSCRKENRYEKNKGTKKCKKLNNV